MSGLKLPTEIAGVPLARVSAIGSASSGRFDDGWCEKNVRLRFRADTPVHACGLEVWLKRDEAKNHSRLSFSLNQVQTFRCEIPHEEVVAVKLACNVPAGREFELAIFCDSKAKVSPGDRRELSFVLRTIHFE